jgi:glycosyltransferase involved in cell wall biosynthesis
MKVSFVSQPYDRLFPPEQNSIGLILYRTALELARFAKLTLYGKKYRNEVLPGALPFEFEAVSIPLDEWLQQTIRKHPRIARRLGVEGWSDAHWQYLRRVGARLNEARPDVLHIMNYWMWCRALKGGGARRIVLDMHCEWLSQRDRASVARELECVDAIVTVSDHVGRQFREAFPDFPRPVATVGNGVDIDVFSPRVPAQAPEGRRRTVLFVGRVSPEKGIHTLLEAFGQIADRFPDVDLRIAGQPWVLSADFLTSLSSDPRVTALLRFYDRWGVSTYQQHVDELMKKFHLERRVSFLGSVPHRKLADVYRDADLVVNPSLSESFGMSVVEGMACAVPVIGTRVGGMCESIGDGETGLLIEPDSPEELAQAMSALLSDPARSRRLGEAGRERVARHYSWEARARKLFDVYRSIPGVA